MAMGLDTGKWTGVAPRAGAWIETLTDVWKPVEEILSHPVRVRGLKLDHAQEDLDAGKGSHPVRVRGGSQHFSGHSLSDTN